MQLLRLTAFVERLSFFRRAEKCPVLQDARGNSRLQLCSINPSGTGNRVMRSFHGVNMTGNKHEPGIARWCDSHEKPADITVYPRLRAHSWFALTFSEKIPEGLCNLFQVNDLTFGEKCQQEAKWALGRLSEVVCAHVFVGFLL